MRMPTVRREDWISCGNSFGGRIREEGEREPYGGELASRGLKKVVIGGWKRRRLEDEVIVV
jgi:hypothetical protein